MERRAMDIGVELAAARAEGRRLTSMVTSLERLAVAHEEEMLMARKVDKRFLFGTNYLCNTR